MNKKIDYKCECCGKDIKTESDLELVGGMYVCKDCYEKETDGE